MSTLGLPAAVVVGGDEPQARSYGSNIGHHGAAQYKAGMDFTCRALVTGASGFVGSGVARKLAERGLAVRALVREASPRQHLSGLDIEFVTGDLRDPDSVRTAMTGVRWLFHVAA